MISASPLKDYLKKQAKLILEMNNLHYSRDRVFTENDTIDRINEQFIKKSTGILHIGGHKGQEAFNYAQHKKQAIFIEAVPEFFEILQSHLKQFPKQQAVCALLGDHNLDSIQFHLASNDGASSSIYPFGSQTGFRDLRMENVINLDMKRLDAIFSKVALLNYNHWVVDVQGAVFKVLVGAGKLLENCDSMMIEVSTREVYNNGVRFNELNEFLEQRGFFPIWIPREGVHQNLMYLRRPS